MLDAAGCDDGDDTLSTAAVVLAVLAAVGVAVSAAAGGIIAYKKLYKKG